MSCLIGQIRGIGEGSLIMKKNVLLAAAAVLGFSAVTAFAADRVTAPARPAAAPAPAPAPAAPDTPWMGVYGGLVGGGLVGASSRWTNSVPQSVTANGPAGEFIGGIAGANFQAGAWVFGLEGDIVRSNAKQDWATAPVATDHLTWIATARGRVGYAWGNALFYGTGGAAWSNIDYTVPGDSSSPGTVMNGWTAGVGIDYLAGRNFFIGTDVLFVRLNNDGEIPATPSGILASTRELAFTMVRAKAALKFP